MVHVPDTLFDFEVDVYPLIVLAGSSCLPEPDSQCRMFSHSYRS
jgi:hypothetical protein